MNCNVDDDNDIYILDDNERVLLDGDSDDNYVGLQCGEMLRLLEILEDMMRKTLVCNLEKC